MIRFLELTVSGLALGSTYALVALGIVVVYRATGLLNLAQGEFTTLAAFLMTTVFAFGWTSWPTALLVTVAIMAAFGAATERTILRPLLARPAFVGSILTIFVGFVIHMGVIVAYGTVPRAMPTPWTSLGVVHLGEVRVTVTNVVTIGTALTIVLSLAWVLKRTRVGRSMRALADDQESSIALGLPTGRLLGLTWALAAGLAAIAGVFLAMPPRRVDLVMSLVVFRAFPAVILGGLDSLVGAVVGGIVLGLVQVHGEFYLNPLLGSFGVGFHLILPFAVMIAVLMVRPHGLLGTPELERV